MEEDHFEHVCIICDVAFVSEYEIDNYCPECCNDELCDED